MESNYNGFLGLIYIYRYSYHEQGPNNVYFITLFVKLDFMMMKI